MHHIVCPNCAASYQVSANAIGRGRSVRCVRCRSKWFQEPPVAEVPPLILTPPPAAPPREAAGEAAVAAFEAELGSTPTPPAPPVNPAAPDPEPPAAAARASGDAPEPSPDGLPGDKDAATAIDDPAPAAEPEAAAPALSDIAIPVAPPTAGATAETEAEENPAEAGGAAPRIESTAARRRRPAARRRLPMQAARMPALILVLVAIVAGLIAARGTVVRYAPQMASLYAAIGLPVNLRGLNFAEVKVSRDTHDGVAVLVVEGTIVSAAAKPVEVPRLRFAMRNEAGAEVYAWTAMPTKEVLAPGETLPFRSRLAAPPNEGRNVTVRFFTRHDAVAGLR